MLEREGRDLAAASKGLSETFINCSVTGTKSPLVSFDEDRFRDDRVGEIGCQLGIGIVEVAELQREDVGDDLCASGDSCTDDRKLTLPWPLMMVCVPA